MNLSTAQLAHLQVEALFVHDANNRLLRINEPDPTSLAARFIITRTTSGNLWRLRHNLPPQLAAELERRAAAEPVTEPLTEQPHYDAEYRSLLAAHAPLVSPYVGPAFWLPEQSVSPGAVAITAHNLGLLLPHFEWLHAALEDYAPVSASIVGEVAVAVCFCSRRTPHVAEAGVYTVAAFRGRGFAPVTVSGWASAVRASGRLPLYSTSWSNHASQAVARRLGAVQYAVNYSIT